MPSSYRVATLDKCFWYINRGMMGRGPGTPDSGGDVAKNTKSSKKHISRLRRASGTAANERASNSLSEKLFLLILSELYPGVINASLRFFEKRNPAGTEIELEKWLRGGIFLISWHGRKAWSLLYPPIYLLSSISIRNDPADHIFWGVVRQKSGGDDTGSASGLFSQLFLLQHEVLWV